MDKTHPTITKRRAIAYIICGILLIISAIALFCSFCWQDSDLFFLGTSGIFGLPILILPMLLLILAFGIGAKLILQGAFSLADQHH